MRTYVLAPVALISVLLGSDLHSQAGREQLASATHKAFDSVVHVYVKFQKRGSVRSGRGEWIKVERPTSGVVVDTKGVVLTNWHLVKEVVGSDGKPSREYWLEVQLPGGAKRAAKLIARNERLDIALVQIALQDGDELTALPLADKVATGTRVAALGRPDGKLQYAFTGAVSFAAARVTLRGNTVEPSEFLLSDAALLPATDGGPLVDTSGRVVGISNPSHVLPAKLDPKPEDLLKPDYAIALSASAIAKAFPGRFHAKSAGAPGPLEKRIAGSLDAIVSVYTGDDPRPTGPGPEDPYAKKPAKGLASGVLIDPSGLVLTNAHIVADPEKPVSVKLASGKTYRGRVLHRGNQLTRNVALIRLDVPPATKLPALSLGVSKTALAGETVGLIGNPYGTAPMVSVGVLASSGNVSLLAIAAIVHPGITGGAVIDSDGRVLGIVDARHVIHRLDSEVRETGIGAAVAADGIRRSFQKDFDAYATGPVVPGAGEADPASRKSKVTEAVARTHASLLNVYVKVAMPQRSTGFDPFAEPAKPRYRYEGLGSGVIIDQSGLAITNWHVVETATKRRGEQKKSHQLEVSLPTGKHYAARVLSTSRDDDLALLELVLERGETLTPVELGDSDALYVGEPVIAIGNPYGRPNTVTAGVVASKGRDIQLKHRVRLFRGLLQTDAAINPGNSGGALLDLRGRLVGINSAGSGWTAGEGYAIPVNRVRSVFRNKLLSAERLRSAYLGFEVGDVQGKVRVGSVNRFGPAARAGIKVGDEVKSIDGKPVSDSVGFVQIARRLRAGAPVRIGLVRDGKELEKSPVPVSDAVWRIFTQSGVELEPVDYAKETQLVRNASLALYRKYTGNPEGAPDELMTGALRVVRRHPRLVEEGADVKPGDLFLGVTLKIRTADLERTELLRFETLADVSGIFDQTVSREGFVHTCWLLRDGKVLTTRLRVTR